MSISYTLDPSSEARFVLKDLQGVEDVTNPDLPGCPTVRPDMAIVLCSIDASGAWKVYSVTANGPKVKGGKVVTQRGYNVVFFHPLDEDDEAAPEDLKRIARDFLALLEGRSADNGRAA